MSHAISAASATMASMTAPTHSHADSICGNVQPRAAGRATRSASGLGASGLATGLVADLATGFGTIATVGAALSSGSPRRARSCTTARIRLAS